MKLLNMSLKKSRRVQKMKKSKLIYSLIFIYFIYSLTVLFSKIASAQLSIDKFLLFYFLSLFFLAIYSILWQLLLKYCNLSTAYPFKVFTILFGIFFGVIFFKETVDLKLIIGTIIIFFGILLIGKSYE